MYHINVSSKLSSSFCMRSGSNKPRRRGHGPRGYISCQQPFSLERAEMSPGSQKRGNGQRGAGVNGLLLLVFWGC